MTNDIDRIRAKHLGKETSNNGLSGFMKRAYESFTQNKAVAYMKDWMSVHKKTVVTSSLVGLTALVGAGFFAKDYITKRQAFPVRNLLYQCQETIYYANAQALNDTATTTDQESIVLITKGDETGARLGEIIGISQAEYTDENSQYQLEDQSKTRIAYNHAKRERFQAGLRLNGATDVSSSRAKLIGKQDGLFLTYTFAPERALVETQLSIVEDGNGKRTIRNILETYRSAPLGWLFGVNFRDKTVLSEYEVTPQSEKTLEKILSLLAEYDKEGELKDSKAVSALQREKLLASILALEKTVPRKVIYSNHEDGIVDWLPQESTIYLFSNPSYTQRFGSAFGKRTATSQTGASMYPTLDNLATFNLHAVQNPNNDIVKLRVENTWDLFPGNYPLLNSIKFGSGANVVKPFAHRNNGGYTIKDDAGVVARIEIQDFILYYGDDVLYKYYLDKNGDGKIEESSELIGQVLYRTSRDGEDIAELATKKAHRADLTRRYVSSFMSGADWNHRFEDFFLCYAMETTMINELMRGFGKHSDLGYINAQRANIILLEHRAVPNLARVLTPDSSLTAKDDMGLMLKAAGRTYITNYLQSVSR